MSANVYNYTPEQIAAMWSAYQGAPDTATVAELRVLMDAAANPPEPEPEDLSREGLIELCRDGVVPQEKWRDRDTSGAQRKLGEARALLTAGCEFTVLRNPGGLCTDKRTVWIEITFAGFGHFDYDGGGDSETYYLPTRKRLNDVDGGDWY